MYCFSWIDSWVELLVIVVANDPYDLQQAHRGSLPQGQNPGLLVNTGDLDFKSFVVAERTVTDVAFSACGSVCVEWGRQSEWLIWFDWSQTTACKDLR